MMKRKYDQGNDEPGPEPVPTVTKPKMTLAQRLENHLGEEFDTKLWIGYQSYQISRRWVRRCFQFTVRFKWNETGKLHIFACEVSKHFQTNESDPVSHFYETVVVAPDDKHPLDYKRIVCDSKGVHVYCHNQTRMDIGRQTTENSSFSVATHCD